MENLVMCIRNGSFNVAAFYQKIQLREFLELQEKGKFLGENQILISSLGSDMLAGFFKTISLPFLPHLFDNISNCGE